MPQRGIILALGGGGVRGLAHFGVLEVLAGARVPIAGIVGTSMGAVAAAVYGAGTSPVRLAELVTVFPWESILDLGLPHLGLAGGEKIQTALELLTKGKSFADLVPPVWVVATDLESGCPVVMHEGCLAPAVRASCAVPGVFAPVALDGRLLIDGGVVAGVPVEIALKLGRPVVAVDVGFDYQTKRARNLLGVLARVVQIMGTELDRRQVSQADLVIRPEVGGVGAASFDLARECVCLGRQAAEMALPEVLALCGGGEGV